MSPAESTLAAVGLTRRFGDLTAVDDVSAELAPGVTALLGPNGAGKTTLIRMLAGVLRPHDGHLSFRGERVTRRSSRSYRSALGYLPQRPTWHGWMTTDDVLTTFAWMHGVPRGDRRELVDRALARVDLQSRRAVRAGRLSGGQFQRLMLATAIVHRPRVLLLDEPSVGLDPAQRAELREILTTDTDRATLISTHVLGDIAPIADRLIVINEGAVRFDGALAEFAARHGQAGDTSTAGLETAYLNLVRGAHVAG